MKKIINLFLLIALLANSFAQNNIPVVKSNKPTAILKINNDSALWYILPNQNPDIFYLENSAKHKSAFFLTDIDSLEFTIEPGKNIDFVIQYNNQNCNARIVAFQNPILLNRYFGYAILWVVLGGFLLAIVKSQSISSKKLMLFGLQSPVIFWIVTIICGLLQGNYNHFKDTVSALGQIGSLSEVPMAIATYFLAIFSLLFSIGFYKASKQNRLNKLPSILSFSMPISFLWAAIFPAGHVLHATLGPLPICILIACVAIIFLWKNNVQTISIKWISCISLIIMLLLLLKFIPSIQQSYEGLLQRTFYVGWSIWSISIGRYFKKINLRIID
jgi:hypothetical protein